MEKSAEEKKIFSEIKKDGYVPDLSVLICSFNRRDTLRRALKALFCQTLSPDCYEVVVVDDGSDDGTREMIESLNPPCQLRYIYQENQGRSVARTKLVENATGNFVLFVDDDIIADPHLLREHLTWILKYPKSTIRGRVNHVSDMENLKAPRFSWADISTAFFWTSNVSVKLEYLKKAGAFDPSFTEYGWEDLEMGVRLRKMGLSAKYNKNALVYHYKKTWNREDLRNMIRQSGSKGRTAVIFFQKHPSWRVRLATDIYAPRFWINNILKLFKPYFEKVAESAKDGRPFTWWQLICARRLCDFAYFDAIRQRLNDPDAEVPQRWKGA
ncbi:MAG: glycosyltransferase [Chloroflexi bacterium]|nr:glycosyltransferase [Chloroflexota bacterium]